MTRSFASLAALACAAGLAVACHGGSRLPSAPATVGPAHGAPATIAPTVAVVPAWAHPTPLVVRSRRGMVVTDNALATEIGRDVLAAGGNAVDAAVATAFALAVTFPMAGNIGGGGFAVVRMRGQPYTLDFRETAPAAASHSMYTEMTGGTAAAARQGIKSVGVPGSVAGLWQLYQRLGSKRLAWAELIAPAIAFAERGFSVYEGFVDTRSATNRLAKFPIFCTALSAWRPTAAGRDYVERPGSRRRVSPHRVGRAGRILRRGDRCGHRRRDGGGWWSGDARRSARLRGQVAHSARVRLSRPAHHRDAASFLGRRDACHDVPHPRGFRSRSSWIPEP